MKNCSLWRPLLEQEKLQGGRISREELLWTDQNSHSPSPIPLMGEEVEESGVKEWSWAWEEVMVGGNTWVCLFVSHYPTLFLIGNKINWSSPCQVCFVHHNNWWVVSPSLSWYTNFFILFSSLVFLRVGSDRAAWWASGSQKTSTHHKHITVGNISFDSWNFCMSVHC